MNSVSSGKRTPDEKETNTKRPFSFDEKRIFSLSNLKPARTSKKSNQPNPNPTNKLALTSLNMLDRVTPKQIPPRKSKKKKPFTLKVVYEFFPFGFCMTDEKCSHYFEQTMQENFCVENYFFYQSVIRFKKMTDTEIQIKLAATIIKEYLLLGSSLELNIEKQKKLECATKFEKILSEKSIPNNLFDEILSLVLTMLKIESYPRFLSSYQFKEYYSKYGHERMKKEEETEIDTSLSSSDLMNEALHFIYTGKTENLPEEIENTDIKMKVKSTLNTKFPFNFCMEDSRCKKFFKEYLGELFDICELLTNYKKTKSKNARKETSDLILSIYLMKSKLIQKWLVIQTLQKFQHLKDCPVDIYDDLHVGMLKLCEEKYENFFFSKEFVKFYDMYGYLYDEGVETIVKNTPLSSPSTDPDVNIINNKLLRNLKSRSDENLKENSGFEEFQQDLRKFEEEEEEEQIIALEKRFSSKK
jgi:hypothetical protein